MMINLKTGTDNLPARKYDSKRLSSSYKVIVSYNRVLTEVASLILMGSGSTVYATLELYGKKATISGYGSAGGGNYDKDFGAFEVALRQSGVTFKGLGGIEPALLQITKVMGFKGQAIVVRSIS